VDGRLFGVEASDSDGLVFEFDRDTGLGSHSASRSGCSLRTTILRGLLTLADRPFGIGGAAWVSVRSAMLPGGVIELWRTLCHWTVDR
jgi:hypothetical protein